jgi:hypothetical protein
LSEIRYRALAERPAAAAEYPHIVRSGLAGDLPGELRETGERGNHLLAIMPADRAPILFRVQLRGIGCDRIAVLELSLSGAVLASARFDLGRIETLGAADCEAACRSSEGFVEIELAFVARTQPRFLALTLLHEGALAYEGDPDRGITIRTIELAGEEIEEVTEPEPAAPESDPEPEPEAPAVIRQPDRTFHPLSQWLDLTRGEIGHSYAWRSGQRRHGALVLVREAHSVQLRIESISAADSSIELSVPGGSAGADAIIAALARQLARSVEAVDDGETQAMARSAIANLDRFIAPLFFESAEAMLAAER